MGTVRDFRDLDVYRRAYAASLAVYQASRRFPNDERFSLTDQIRRSSRSVCANMAEAWRKRRYPASFVSKLSDADGEAAETSVWLDFAIDHHFLTREEGSRLKQEYDVIQRQLTTMIGSPANWCMAPAVRHRHSTHQ